MRWGNGSQWVRSITADDPEELRTIIFELHPPASEAKNARECQEQMLSPSLNISVYFPALPCDPLLCYCGDIFPDPDYSAAASEAIRLVNEVSDCDTELLHGRFD
jgi:hypothetical protein